ncbi:MAG: S1-like domain-containing RNA-binding protein, partial [Saprospiraceae bacterium]
MIAIGEYNNLRVLRETVQGLYLDDGKDGILLPKRFVPEGAKFGDELKVFVYHDKEGRPIATTQTPKGIVGDIVKLKVAGTTPQGAFLDNGLMKDIFVPRSKQLQVMLEGSEYLVMIYLDELTN